jgi:hypothetical protein
MTAVHAVLGFLALALTVAAAAWGSWRWWRVEPSELFWRLLRAGQVLIVLEALVGGVLYLLGERPGSGLHYVYGLTPIVVYFLAEQLRLSSAETVLQARDLEDAAAMRALPEATQRSIVLQIVRREMGVMTLAALVTVGLLARAAF